jgi:hypothetical protein
MESHYKSGRFLCRTSNARVLEFASPIHERNAVATAAIVANERAVPVLREANLIVDVVVIQETTMHSILVSLFSLCPIREFPDCSL